MEAMPCKHVWERRSVCCGALPHEYAEEMCARCNDWTGWEKVCMKCGTSEPEGNVGYTTDF